jgi:DNA primase
VHVFDISQTEGEELPALDAVRPKLLDGAAPEGIWDALTGHATSIGYEVIRDRRGNENGYCDFLNKQIGVRPDVSGAQAVKTLIHEVGHALLHAEGPVASREVAEVEVESVAYIVCDALGLDSSDYSFPYVTRWAEGSSDLIKETAERVIGCAKHILAWLEEKPTMAA